jgi:hypothetical protein
VEKETEGVGHAVGEEDLVVLVLELVLQFQAVIVVLR